MSEIRVDTFKAEDGIGAPSFPNGLNIAGVATATTFSGAISGTTGTFSSHVSLGDGDELRIGDSSDLKLYHTAGTANYIQASGGHANIHISNVHQLKNQANDEFMLTATNGGSVELYHNNSSKLATTSTGVTVTGTVSDSKGDLRKIIHKQESSAYTLVAADAGKAIEIASGGITVPASVFGAGDAVTIINDSSSAQTITKGSGLNMFNSADATNSNRTLGGRGMATIYFVNSSTSYISGAGLS